jgi:diaminopimelate epimerase
MSPLRSSGSSVRMAPEMRFEKWQALGNHYVIVEEDALPWELTPERIRRLCEPHTGIGSDGILLISEVGDQRYVAGLRIFNPDGSEAELSGNGAREAVLYLRRSGWTDDDEFAILTKAGEIRPSVRGPQSATIAMGRASVASPDYPSGGRDGTGTVTSAGREWGFQHVSIGNPQCVIDAGPELEDLDLAVIGPSIERSELFPNRTNVSFIRVDGSNVRARIFERGVGETLSSGTGASGAAVAAFMSGARSPITVHLDGGELIVEVTDDLDVRQSGTASPVYRGELSQDLVRELATVT